MVVAPVAAFHVIRPCSKSDARPPAGAPGLCDQRYRVTRRGGWANDWAVRSALAGPDAGLSPPLGRLCCSVALVRAVRWLRRPGRSGGGSWSGTGSTAEVVRAAGAGGEHLSLI